MVREMLTMRRMSGYDAAFIYDESPNEPQHTLKVCFLDQAASGRYSFARLRRQLRLQIPEIEPLRWRSRRLPFDLHHPVWLDSGTVNIERHVFRVALPSPAGKRELCDLISQIASQPLDPTRPLWELWAVEGYRNEGVVLLLKLSHALADGGCTKRLLESLFSDENPFSSRTCTADDIDEAPSSVEPSRWTLVVDGVRDLAWDFFLEIPKLARRAITRLGQRSGTPQVAAHDWVPSPFTTPRTPFAGPLSRRRTFSYCSVSFDDVREMRRHFDCTVNDVILATAAGAVRRYLARRGELPGLPVFGGMVASTRRPDQAEQWGNRITSRFIQIPSQEADPIKRLRQVQRIAAAAKEDVSRWQGTQVEDWVERFPPLLVKLISKLLRLTLHFRPQTPGGVLVSSVAGPKEPFRVFSGAVENFVSVGHMKFSAGLNITTWSYADKLNFGLYACAEAVPDLWRIAGDLEASFEELHRAVCAERKLAA